MKYCLGRFLTILLMMVSRLAAKKKMLNIFWNTTSPMFRIDNTDHIIDINRGNFPFEYDQANIICPVYPQSASDRDMEKYIIYSVGREEYENCRIINPNPKVVAVCDKPHQLSYVTVTFRAFTPTPGGLEFKPGHDYYFISTSSATDLHRRVGGRCSTHHMKAMFKVAAVDADANNDVASRTVNVPRSFGGNQRLNKNEVFPSYRELDSNAVDNHSKRSDEPFVSNVEDEDAVVKQASVMQPKSSGVSLRRSDSFMVICAVSVLSLFHGLRTSNLR